MRYKNSRRFPISSNIGARVMQAQRNARQYLLRSKRAAALTRLANRGGRANRILQSARPYGSAETKVVDTVNGSGNITLNLNTTPNLDAMNLIQSGSAFYQRVGRRVEMQSLHLYGFLNQTGTAAQEGFARILVIYDRQTNGALPSYATLMANYDQSGTATSSVYSGLNPDERERFVILADFKITTPYVTAATFVPGSTDGPSGTYKIDRFIKLRGLQTHYKADSVPAVIGDVATGSLLLVGVGDKASGSEGWNAVLSWRIRYSDT